MCTRVEVRDCLGEDRLLLQDSDRGARRYSRLRLLKRVSAEACTSAQSDITAIVRIEALSMTFIQRQMS